MDSDFSLRRRGALAAAQPIEALCADHRLIRQLFHRYFAAQAASDKQDAGVHLLLLLEMHASLEDGVFYPRVREIDPALLGQCEHAHEQAELLIATLKSMDEADPQAVALFEQLAAAVLPHIDREERQLFAKVRQAKLDLGAIGREMLALESRMLVKRADRARARSLRQ